MCHNNTFAFKNPRFIFSYICAKFHFVVWTAQVFQGDKSQWDKSVTIGHWFVHLAATKYYLKHTRLPVIFTWRNIVGRSPLAYGINANRLRRPYLIFWLSVSLSDDSPSCGVSVGQYCFDCICVEQWWIWCYLCGVIVIWLCGATACGTTFFCWHAQWDSIAFYAVIAMYVLMMLILCHCVTIEWMPTKLAI